MFLSNIFKTKEKYIFTDLRPVAQVKREMKQTSLMEEHKLCHHSRPTFEPFIKNDVFWKKNSQILSGEKTIGTLEFGETDTQRSFKSLYMTCLGAKKLQDFEKCVEFPMVPFISQLFSLVRYIFSNLVTKRDFLKNQTVNEYGCGHTKWPIYLNLFTLPPELLNI